MKLHLLENCQLYENFIIVMKVPITSVHVKRLKENLLKLNPDLEATFITRTLVTRHILVELHKLYEIKFLKNWQRIGSFTDNCQNELSFFPWIFNFDSGVKPRNKIVLLLLLLDKCLPNTNNLFCKNWFQ